MSKQEKLAALIQATRNQHFGDHGTWNDLVRAISDYDSTPDDPPEMPECVRSLLVTADKVARSSEVPTATMCDIFRAINSVEDHYRQPLKLEVGKVYEDDAGTKVQVVFENKQPGTKYPFLCVFLDTATPYYSDGFSLIREVKQ